MDIFQLPSSFLNGIEVRENGRHVLVHKKTTALSPVISERVIFTFKSLFVQSYPEYLHP